jgi:hypothetical protein
LFVEVVLQEDILNIYFTIGKAHINLSTDHK